MSLVDAVQQGYGLAVQVPASFGRGTVCVFEDTRGQGNLRVISLCEQRTLVADPKFWDEFRAAMENSLAEFSLLPESL